MAASPPSGDLSCFMALKLLLSLRVIEKRFFQALRVKKLTPDPVFSIIKPQLNSLLSESREEAMNNKSRNGIDPLPVILLVVLNLLSLLWLF